MTLARGLRRLSDGLVVLERLLLMALISAVATLVVLNVSFRAFRVTLAWADELAILSMTLTAFVGASLMLRAASISNSSRPVCPVSKTTSMKSKLPKSQFALR